MIDTLRGLSSLALGGLLFLQAVGAEDKPIPPLPDNARLVLEETWESGEIDPEKWYALRKQWGQNNHGVVPENVSIVREEIDGEERAVLQCEAHGDDYPGPVTGRWGRPDRVGGVLVSHEFFCSGRFEVQMKIGTPEHPHPAGAVPAVWLYGYRAIQIDEERSDEFPRDLPLYHPFLQEWKKGQSVFLSELDFPEYGMEGKFERPMYNTFLNKQHKPTEFDVGGAADGHYHTYTSEWRTYMRPIANVTDDQVVEAEGFYWVRDAEVPYHRYWGNPLKRMEDGSYFVYIGKWVRHWVDGRYIGQNTENVPSMGAQLNLGVWLPKWAGPAAWETSSIRFGDVRVWQYDDPGDVRGILTENLKDNFKPVEKQE